MFSKIVSKNKEVSVVFNNKFVITSRGDVYDLKDNVIKSYERGGISFIELDGVEYRLVDLIAVHFKELLSELNKDQLKLVEGFIINDKVGLKPSNVGYRFKGNLIESIYHKGFYHIPEHPSIVVNKETTFLRNSDGKELKPYIHKGIKERNIKGGYLLYYYNINGRRECFSRHRTNYMTFKGYPDNIDSLQINHIDGEPGNDDLSNLELVTPGGNLRHAFENGLRNDNFPVLSLNIHTGEEREFYSMCNCAEELGYSDMTIGNIINKVATTSVTKRGHTFKLKSDETPWMDMSKLRRMLQSIDIIRPVKARNCKTMEVLEFDSVLSAGRHAKINDSSIIFRLNQGNYKPLFGWQFIEKGKFPDFTKEEYEESLLPSAYSVSARNVLTGETREYDSVNKCTQDLKKTHAAIRLRSGTQPLYSDGWQLKYAEDVWTDIENPVETCRRLLTELTLICVKTGEYLYYESAKKAYEAHGGRAATYRTRAINNSDLEYQGYLIRLGTLKKQD